MGKRILVLGSSFGGYTAAIRAKRLLGSGHHVKVVSSEDVFTFIPSLPWVVMGWRKPSQIAVNISERLKKRGIEFAKDTVLEVLPEKNRVRGENGEYEYDYLVAATGAELDFAAISGLGPVKGFSNAIFSTGQAMEAHRSLMKLIESGGGSIVLGNAQGASCLGPSYEMAMMIDSYLRKAGMRNNFRISFFTNEPFLGHFGVGGFGKMTRLLEDEFADRDIEWRINSRIEGVTREFVELDGDTRYKNDWSLVIPAFYGNPAYSGAEGLSNPRHFLHADEYLSNPVYRNIYAVGVILAIAPPGSTPVPVGVPKTGQMTERMAEVAAENIAADIRGTERRRGKDFSVSCIADAGDTGFYIHASPLLPPRNRLIHRKGRFAHYGKVVFEKLYMASLRYNLPVPDFGW